MLWCSWRSSALRSRRCPLRFCVDLLLRFHRCRVSKGQAAQCESLVPLLRYYFAEGNLKEEHLQTHLKSFEDLAMCCAHLRALRYQWSEIAHQDVDSLLAVQERHQKSFLECYSAECIKPKHHQRFHLGQSFLQMRAT